MKQRILDSLHRTFIQTYKTFSILDRAHLAVSSIFKTCEKDPEFDQIDFRIDYKYHSESLGDKTRPETVYWVI